ncbi:MAG: signal peptide peptidase SppA [Bacillota bacterium]
MVKGGVPPMRKKVVVVGMVAAAIASIALLVHIGPRRLEELSHPRLGSLAERIAVVYLQGPIAEGRSPMSASGVITPRLVSRYLERLEADGSVKAVVLRIDSPGGSVAASQAIAGMVKEFPKPIVVSMGDIVASGGYYISAPADRIVALPGTMTGSIGVITTITDLEGLYEKLGIREQVIKSGKHKDMYRRALTLEERQIVQRLSDDAYEQFVTEVAAARGMPVERVRELATGELFLGSRAQELGLVDELGDLDDAVDVAVELAGVRSPVVYEVPPPAFFGRFWDLVGDIQGALRTWALSPDERLLWRLRQETVPELRY